MTKRCWVGVPVVLLLLLSSRLAGATITMTGTSPGGAGVLNVGSVVVGATGQNTGTLTSDVMGGEKVDLTITTTCTGGAGTFTFVGSGTNLNLNPSATITVQYAPTARGQRECDVTMTVMGTSTPITFKVRGTGVAPVVSAPATLSLTSVRVNDSAVVAHTSSTTLTIGNTSNDVGQTLSVSNVTCDNGDFTITPPGNTNIAPQGSANWTVTFNPSAVGSRTGTITIESNDPLTPSKTLMVSGTGLGAVIGVGDVNFGNVAFGGTGNGSITVSNTQASNPGTLTAQTAALSQSVGTWFSFGAGSGCMAGQVNCTLSGVTALPPATGSVPVRCIPPTNEVGTRTATVTFTSDSDSAGDASSLLTCTSQPHPNVSVSTASLAFGTQLVLGTSGSLPITVTNNGNSDLTFYWAEAGTDTAMFAESTTMGCGDSMVNQCTVTPGSNIVINVTFTPGSRGLKSATLNINTNDPDTGDNVKAVSLGGTGVAPQIGVSPSPYDYLGVRVNDLAFNSTKSQVFTISNASNDAGQILTISSITFSGTHKDDFSVTTAGATSINPSSNTPYTITFNPSGSGLRTATMNIATNDPLTPTRMITLSGTGTTGIIGVSAVDFMTVSAGMTGNASVTVSNTSLDNPGVLTASSATISSVSGWFSFGVGSGCNGGTSCTLSGVTMPTDKMVPVRCSPPAAASGTVTGTITFTSDTDAGGVSSAMLTCTAGRPNIVVTVTPLDFMNVVVGQTSMAQTISIKNDGNTPLTFWLSESGADTTMFAEAITGQATCGFAAGTPCTVAPNMTMTQDVTVTFSPTSPGPKSATLNINNNDPDAGDNVKSVMLGGNGTAGVATPNVSSIAFGNVEVGKTTNNTTLTITNSGMSALTISNAGLVSGGVLVGMTTEYTAAGTVGAQSTIVPSGMSASWDINCHPTSQGLKSATFRVLSNGYGTATVDIPLTCTGQQGVLVVTGGTLPVNFYDFGPVPQMPPTPPFRDFTLTNTGNVAVNNINVTYNAAQLAGFSISLQPSGTFPINLAANGGSATIRVTFNPQAGTDGCAVAAGVTCGWTFTGGWGVTPTNTSATAVTIGDGLVQGYDTSPSYPNAVDFGNVRFDQTKDMTFQIINTAGVGGANVGVAGISITPGTAMSGEFTIIGCCRGTPTCTPLTGPGPGGCPTMAAPFSLPPASNPIVVTVRMDPNDRVAMMDATVVVTSNPPVGAMPNRSVPLKGNSITAGIAVTPATNVLDFGATDLDAVPVSVTKTITLMNTGTADLNVGNGVTGGPDLARYQFSSVTSRIVASGQPFDIDVTYTPTIEKPANQPDVATLMFPLTGIHGGPSSVTIQITGYGADRHISVGNAPMFPDTYVNPGPLAPELPVTITNNGDAKLHLTALMLDGAPIWTLVNDTPAEVLERGTYDLNVRFSPVEVGKAPTGHLVVVNDDNGMQMVSVELNGNGIDRRVDFGPEVEFGYVGIGLTERLSNISPNQLLDVANKGDDPVHIVGFDTDDPAFEIIDLDGSSVKGLDTSLQAGETLNLDVRFKPDRVGDYDAIGLLHFEGGATQPVPLRGKGIYADARGGGGCSTTRGGSHGWLVLVLGALLAAARRRRRTATVAVVIAAAAGTAAADERDIDLDVFDPTPSTVGGTFHVQHADIGADGSWAASALVTYANDALVVKSIQNDDAAVKMRALLTLGGAYVFGGRFEAGAHVPVVIQSGDELASLMMRTTRFTLAPGDGASLADVSVHLKARLGHAPVANGSFVYGAGLTLTLPTATGEFGGNDKPTGRVLLLGSLSLGKRISASVNAGGILRGTTRYASLNQGSGVAWGAGATYWLLQQLFVTGEIFGELIPGGHFADDGSQEVLNTIEGLGGVHYRPTRTTSLGVAVGRGVTSGPGAPAFRGLLTFSYTPDAEALGVLHPPTTPKPPADDDGDSVPNSKDECPVDKEDLDQFQDEDGCPDTDNDKDGYADGVDKCPLQAEDRDGIDDQDGCPDGDNDGDGIDDKKDKCPVAAEDKDGFQDQDGCPEPDNDKDGLLDGIDKCPNEAEVINGVTDDDGCPDKGDSLIVLSPDRLELLENVTFKGSKIDTKASANVLGQLGATLRAHPEIVRVRLGVHVQPGKDAAADQKLSDARAKAVREWLIDYGIDALRMQASGFGGKQPLIPPTTKGAQQINDRLDIVVLERK